MEINPDIIIVSEGASVEETSWDAMESWDKKPTAVSTHTKVTWTSNLARNLWVAEDTGG